MWPAMLSKPRKRWPLPCARRWRSSMPTSSIRPPTAVWRRCRASCDRQTSRLKRRRRDRSPRAGGTIRQAGLRALLPVNFLSGPLPAQRQVAASGRQIARRATALHNGNSASRSRIDRLRRGVSAGPAYGRAANSRLTPRNPRRGERPVVGAQRRLLGEKRDQVLG